MTVLEHSEQSSERPTAPHTSPPAAPPRRRVRARRPLTPESLAERGDVDPGSPEAASAERLLSLQAAASRAYAVMLLELSTLWVERDQADLADDREENDLVIAIALRTTTREAGTQLRDAHIATSDMPQCFHALSAGEMPAAWFTLLLRSVRHLDPERRVIVDEQIAGWDLRSIPLERFRTELRQLIAWFDAHAGRTRPEDTRDVALSMPHEGEGTACLTITGPIPEILALSRRLDRAGHAVQAAQRHALAEDSEPAPIPFDLDGDVAAQGRPMRLAALRYAVLTRSVLDTGGIEVPRERFRLNVTVPVLSLLGHSEAPATLDGTIPIPADMARRLAAEESTLYRVLTDPVAGRFLPAAPKQYRPGREMEEYLRLVDPLCAAPGCDRSTSSIGENDHIEEYRHDCPEAGGPTSIENLHRLCWRHHDLKTRRRIDPSRDPDDPTTTTWTVRRHRARAVLRQNRDLTTPLLAAALQDSWDTFQWHLELDALEANGTFARIMDEMRALDANDYGEDPGDEHCAEPPPF
ncbi:MAG TPA: HNH endonuclease [Candidatus Brachybacterium merdigallinarum]|nr:HNH endonuclease [Candidatus Brachybacterium merdigallinarum]